MCYLCINTPDGRQYHNTRKATEPAQVRITVTQIQLYTYRVDLETCFHCSISVENILALPMFVAGNGLKYIHKSQSLFRFKFIKTFCIIPRQTFVHSSINRRYSPRNIQQNILEAMAFVKNILKTGFIYSVFHKVGEFSY